LPAALGCGVGRKPDLLVAGWGSWLWFS